MCTTFFVVILLSLLSVARSDVSCITEEIIILIIKQKSVSTERRVEAGGGGGGGGSVGEKKKTTPSDVPHAPKPYNHTFPALLHSDNEISVIIQMGDHVSGSPGLTFPPNDQSSRGSVNVYRLTDTRTV